MTDLLDVTPPRPSRHRPRRWAPKILGVLLVLALLVGLSVTAAYGVNRIRRHFAGAPDYHGAGVGTVVVQVLPGDTAYSLADRLAQLGVVESAGAFRHAAANNSKASSLLPGSYQLHLHMSAARALALLLDPASRLVGKVVVPEGSTERQTLALVAAVSHIPLADLQRAAADPTALGLPAYAGGHVEGFLFPATYDIPPGTTAVAALTMMVQRFAQAADSTGLVSRAAALGLSPYQVVIVASLAEKEAGVAADFPKVARVVYNRLAAHMPLQLDSTVNYLRSQRKARLSDHDIAVDTPYNTYKHAGLPPTPIDAPGEAALEAALAPAPGNWIYFITIDKSGNSLFTHSYSQFLAAKAKAQRDGVY